MIDVSEIACGVALPGIDSLAAALLMRDGSWRTDPSLCAADRRAVTRWINQYGNAFRAQHESLLGQGSAS